MICFKKKNRSQLNVKNKREVLLVKNKTNGTDYATGVCFAFFLFCFFLFHISKPSGMQNTRANKALTSNPMLMERTACHR